MNPKFNFIELEIREKYALVGLNRPKAYNALNIDLLNDLINVTNFLSEEAKKTKLRLVIFYGVGEKAFAAGADISIMQKFLENKDSEALDKYLKLGKNCTNLIENSNFISIAAINGFALGGGLELALACDIRLASGSSTFGLPEVSLGIFPGFGGAVRLPRIIGRGLATELILTGNKINTGRAYWIGLVNQILPTEDFMNHVIEYAQKLITGGSKSAQLTAKQVVKRGLEMDLTNAYNYETELFEDIFMKNSDVKEGINAFIEKRKPSFSDNI